MGETPSTPSNAEAALVIRPPAGWQAIDFADLWRFRELLWMLAQRDIKVRYKQTALGVLWAVLQPVATMVIFSLFFGYLARLSARIENSIPYPVYTLCALLPWQLFANSLHEAGNSLVTNQQLITKVYFPRLLVPLATVVAGLVDFGIVLFLMVLLLLVYGIVPSAAIVFLPLFVLLAFLAALSMGLWLSALNVLYRDFRYVIPFLTQFWMFATPIAYPSSIVRNKSELLYAIYGLNPMVGVVDGFRWALLGTAGFPGAALASSAACILVLLAGGLFFFRRTEASFAEVV